MFTAGEVIWLTKPLTIRPAQYRPDIVIRAREAMMPENLWSPDYKPSVIQRDACRRLQRLVQSLDEETEPEPIAEIDVDLADPDASDEAADLAFPADSSAVVKPEAWQDDSPAVTPREEEFAMAL